LDQHRLKMENCPLIIDRETDRVYGATTSVCVIDDPFWQRRILITKAGSNSTVVWNPWIEKSGRMTDMPAGGYLTMVCVETTNAAPDIVVLTPGAEHRLAATIECGLY
jgi:D-hexose-6-phosphate mutarotase